MYFILRTIDQQGLQSNIMLGTDYKWVCRTQAPADFQRALDAIHPDQDYPSKLIGFIFNGNGVAWHIYEEKYYYIMTDNGSTFEKLPYIAEPKQTLDLKFNFEKDDFVEYVLTEEDLELEGGFIKSYGFEVGSVVGVKKDDKRTPAEQLMELIKTVTDPNIVLNLPTEDDIESEELLVNK